jgi:hypothetical protein
MKTTSQFEYLSKLFNPKNLDFEEIYLSPNYAIDTLINGNISECITYLRSLIGTGLVGISVVNDELSEIKIHCPERYNYVKEKVFSPKPY